MKRMILALGIWLLIVSAACTSSAIPSTAPYPTGTRPADGQPLDTPQVDSTPDEIKRTPEAPTPAAMGGLADEQFDLALAKAFEARDFSALRAMMRARFSFATWNTSLVEVSSEEAIQNLQETLLASGATPRAVFSSDVPALLSGTDPLSLWGPVANPVRAMHVVGLGPQARSEAVLVIGRDPSSGQNYWHGVLIPPVDTFQGTSSDSGDVVPTEVTRVKAQQIVDVRSGPGPNFSVLATLKDSEIAQVDAISRDGQWWRTPCMINASGFCWISTDPSFTQPEPKTP